MRPLTVTEQAVLTHGSNADTMSSKSLIDLPKEILTKVFKEAIKEQHGDNVKRAPELHERAESLGLDWSQLSATFDSEIFYDEDEVLFDHIRNMGIVSDDVQSEIREYANMRSDIRELHTPYNYNKRLGLQEQMESIDSELASIEAYVENRVRDFNSISHDIKNISWKPSEFEFTTEELKELKEEADDIPYIHSNLAPGAHVSADI